MVDVTVVFGSFSSTEVEFRAESEAARAVFAEKVGAGAVSFTVRKSDAPRVAEQVEACGLTVA